jgi:hypothetical protein
MLGMQAGDPLNATSVPLRLPSSASTKGMQAEDPLAATRRCAPHVLTHEPTLIFHLTGWQERCSQRRPQPAMMAEEHVSHFKTFIRWGPKDRSIGGTGAEGPSSITG